MKRIKGKNVVLENGVVLTDSEKSKLEHPQNIMRVAAYAKDMHFDYYIEENGNVSILVITRNVDMADDATMHDIEMVHNNFMSWIDSELTIPAQDEKNEDRDKDLEFIKDLLKNIEGRPVHATLNFLWFVRQVQGYIPPGHIGCDLLVRILKAYISVYDSEG